MVRIKIKELQKITPPGTSHILRKALSIKYVAFYLVLMPSVQGIGLVIYYIVS